eukprot:TRINITY_DN6637_c0_g1_i2.p1 TRINITY_DN6637_c0_g1~~TRINITY_DN6637_c0_g1_i2.p1  ORF type:complete len:1770 (-),score=245.50 TRINITY_DN6637_c0_g1_i2:8-5317(-)
MRMLGILFAVFVLCRAQSHFLPVPSLGCTYFDDTAAPQGRARDLGTCPYSSVCCPSSYESQIESKTDPISVALRGALTGSIPESCSAAIDSLACTVCAPDQSTYMTSFFDYHQLKLCPSFCDSLYNSCGQASVKSTIKSVAESFPSGNAFCSKLFSGLENIVVSIPKHEDNECFNPAKPACTAEDIGFSYTACVLGKYDLQFYWAHNNCTAGISLPKSKEDIACPVSCLAGSYLPLGEEECLECPAGTFSLGGGHRIVSFKPLPTRFMDFSTWCEDKNGNVIPTDQCEGWKGYNKLIDANIRGKASTSSILEATATLYNDGEIKFIAQIDAEKNWDVLVFKIDGVVQTLEPYAMLPTNYTFPVSAGYHTFRWEYVKDILLDVGLDTVWILEIEITNMLAHNNHCTECPEGYSSNAGATECYECPENTYAGSLGSATCSACNVISEYSKPGASSCTQREACVEADYYAWYTECRTDGKRTQKHSWIEPKICKGGVHLPADTTVACAPCNPGFYLEDGQCKACQEGWSSVAGSTQCVKCNAGTYAPKELIYDVFHTHPDGWKTGCSWGDCADGWILEGDYLSSGSHVESSVQVYFTLTVEITAEPFGYLSLEYDMFCSHICWFEIYDGESYLSGIWKEEQDTGLKKEGIQLTPGVHEITFNLIQIMGNATDETRIHKIKIEGVDKGGAETCRDCVAGTYSANAASSCTACPVGTFSGNHSASCTPCPANTFADSPQSEKCLPCGENTVTPSKQAECSTGGCLLRDTDGNVALDISDLGRDSIKSVLDGDYEYFVHPCTKMMAGPCTVLGKPTFACRRHILTQEVEDFGRVQGYELLLDGNAVLKFTQGDQPDLCGQGTQENPIPRTLQVTLICDETAGYGHLEVSNGNEEDTFPDNCSANFQWRTAHICNPCTPDDYSYIVGVCEGGVQPITYYWKEPKVCVGGVSLPLAKERACGALTCNPGQFLQYQVCKKCEENTYSVGNGQVYSVFTSDSIAPFQTTCGMHHVTTCTEWSLLDGRLISGIGNSTLTLQASFNYGQDSITFDYDVGGHGLFSFFVDNEPTPRLRLRTTISTESSFTTDVMPGQHTFKWVYYQETLPYPNARAGFVRLDRVRVVSVSNVLECSTCAPGLVPTETQDGCMECPPNHHPIDGACQFCPTNMWRLPGEGINECSPMEDCTKDDFLLTYPNVTLSSKNTFCGDGSSKHEVHVSYLPVTPRVCKGSVPSPESSNQCIPCPTGYLWSSEKCQPCLHGQYLTTVNVSGSQEPVCQDPPALHAPVYSRHFFDHKSLVTDAKLPHGWTTSCHGTCSNDGWVMTNHGVSTGNNFGTVTSVLQYEADLYLINNLPTYVSFMLEAGPPQGSKKRARTISGIEFFVGRRQQELSFDLDYKSPKLFHFGLGPNGLARGYGERKVNLTWVFSHSGGHAPHVTISEVSIIGTKGGVALQETPCPPGTSVSSSNGERYCEPCPVGTFGRDGKCYPCSGTQTSTLGSTTCSQCSTGTSLSSSGTCETTCVFNISTSMTWIDPSKDLDKSEVALSFDIRGIEQSVEWRDHTGNSYYFHINPCTRMSANTLCPTCNQTGEAYAYMQIGSDSSTPYELGNSVEFRTLSGLSEDGHSASGFMLAYSHGNHLPDHCRSVTTNINFVCSESSSQLQIESIPEDSANFGVGPPKDCIYRFKWGTSRACRRCLESDWTLVDGGCVNGWRQSHLLVSEHDVEVPILWGWVITISIIVILITVLVLPIVVFCKKRQLQNRYQALQERLNGGEEFDRL